MDFHRLISEVERRANHCVDVLAKRAAGLIRLPKEVVNDWTAQRKDLTSLVEFLGDVVGYGLGAKLWKSKSDFAITLIHRTRGCEPSAPLAPCAMLYRVPILTGCGLALGTRCCT